MKKMIVFFGVIGSGKTFNAEKYIKEHPDENCYMLGFSDGVREFTWKLLDWKPENFDEYTKFKDYIWKEVNGRAPKLTGRKLMQEIGTDIVRTVDPDFWAKYFFDKASMIYEKFDNVTIVVPDLRYPNELDKIFILEKMFSLELHIYYTAFNEEKALKGEMNQVLLHESERFAKLFLGKFHHLEEITENLREFSLFLEEKNTIIDE